MADNGNHGGIRMWLSLEVASRISDWANLAFIGSLVAGVVATVLIVWMANVKEGHWDRERDAAKERIAGLLNDTQRLSGEADAAKALIATAHRVAASASERAADLEVEAGRLRLALTAASAETARIAQGVASAHVRV